MFLSHQPNRCAFRSVRNWVPTPVVSQRLSRVCRTCAVEQSQSDRPVRLIANAAVPPIYKPVERERSDTREDALFYAEPCFEHHGNSEYRAHLTGIYEKLIPTEAKILDLCSSWASHLPDSGCYQSVVGLGMNTRELHENQDLTSRITHDLNHNPRLVERSRLANLLTPNSFDAVTCANGLQYLKWPETVVKEVYDLLRPKGVFIVSFGDNYQQQKATAGWIQRSSNERVELVERLLSNCGFSSIEVFVPSSEATQGEPLYVLAGRKEVPRDDGADSDFADLLISPSLADMSLRDLRSVSDFTRDQWRVAYDQLCQDAKQMGIPSRVIPALPPQASVEQLQDTKGHLEAMIASFLSAGL